LAVGKSQKKVVKKSDHQSSQKQSLRLQTDSGLNDVQLAVFLETREGRSYKDIAKQLGYEPDYIKQVGLQ
jgi:DNA-binding CsgD family transcriptional regulator